MTASDQTAPDGATQIGRLSPADRLLTALLFTALGLSVGLLVPVLANWAATVPWMPLQGPLRLIGGFDHAWLTWGRPIIGALLGLGLALWVLWRMPVLTLTDDRIEARTGSDVVVIRREQVDGVRRTGGTLLIVNRAGRELFRGDVDGKRDRLREAFERHDYPWESS